MAFAISTFISIKTVIITLSILLIDKWTGLDIIYFHDSVNDIFICFWVSADMDINKIPVKATIG